MTHTLTTTDTEYAVSLSLTTESAPVASGHLTADGYLRIGATRYRASDVTTFACHAGDLAIRPTPPDFRDAASLVAWPCDPAEGIDRVTRAAWWAGFRTAETAFRR